MEQAISKIIKLSHKQFRAMLKKFRRKKKRQQLAKERDQLELQEQQKRESSPNYKETQEELRRNIELYEQFEERESVRQNKLWLMREQQAQEEFKRKQHQFQLESIRREQERKRILEEFEKQQFVENRALEENQKIKSQKEEVLQVALSNLAEKEDGPWHNPIAPEHYNTGIDREQCMFFSKTGCCRFGDRCSRGHTRPDVSRTILIRGMYSHFSIGQTATDDYDTDIALEYEDKECYQHFRNFYNDVLPEFKKFGRVIQFKVCSNFEAHLRGNVYIQYASEQDALEAYKNFHGRYYAGKQITCEFTTISRWKAAICGLYGKKMCPKGINCNFLHVFRNPNDEFWEADRDIPPRTKNINTHFSRNRESQRDDRYSYHSSEHRRRNEYRNIRYEPRSERHDHRGDRYESRSERYESRSERHESRSERHESRKDRYDSMSEKYESSNYYDNRSSESDTDSSGENNYYSKSSTPKNDSYNSWYKKRHRDSRSRSKSPSEISNGVMSSSKRKKHKRKSKKSKKNYSSDSDN